MDLFQTDMKFEEKIEGKNLHAIVSKDARCFIYAYTLNARRVSIIISFYMFRKISYNNEIYMVKKKKNG